MNTHIVPLTLLLLLTLGATAAMAEGTSAPDPSGFIYGTVTTESGNRYTGPLRWGTEETFWDDLFHSSKEDLPYLEKAPKEERRRRRIKVLGITIGYRWDDVNSSRVFIARFGDIQSLEPRSGDEVDLVMRSGTKYRVEGYSNDVGAAITVDDASLGRVKLDWKRIEKIEFQSTPKKLDPGVFRVYGAVETDDTTFEGFIQWDLQECISTDMLDGESPDGDMSIEMGKILSIEKRNRDGSTIVLKDGRSLVLEDTNDVDSSLRGIFVEDERYGRVEIPWEAFRKVTFREVDHTGKGYDDYAPGTPLQGTVTDYDGKKYTGRMAFDLDETETWELLNGSRDDVEFSIPFGRIRSIEPDRGDRSRLVLDNDISLELSDGQDVSESNAGVVVLRGDDDREVYISWRDIRRIDFTEP